MEHEDNLHGWSTRKLQTGDGGGETHINCAGEKMEEDTAKSQIEQW